MASEVAESTPVTIIRAQKILVHPIDTSRDLWTVRLALPPGGGLPFWSYPNITIVYAESGVIGFTSVTGNVNLVLASGARRAFTGGEYLLQAGDTASFGPGVQQSIRNPATAPASFVVTTILPRNSSPFEGLPTSEGLVIRFDS